MGDKIEKYSNSLIQHGKDNDRIYLMKFSDSDDFVSIHSQLQQLASDNNYSKLFYKLKSKYEQACVSAGFKVEAKIPKFFNGVNSAVFCGKFLTSQREFLSNKETPDIKFAIDTAKSKSPVEAVSLDAKYTVSLASKDDADSLAKLYGEVFESYPFPIDNPDYIRKTMDTHIDYFIVFYQGQVVAASSAERDDASQNVEMTDFATQPTHRGNNIAIYLLLYMEKQMRKKGIKTAYTIARSFSVGMNVVFAKAGYMFGGTLVNNTNICGKLESMNIWYKPL